jgi:crossover junction endodeoxyribonuclease RuvC
MIILGIDPGTATTGFGVIKREREKNNLKCLDFGCMKTDPNLPAGPRLKQLSSQLNKLIKKYKPDVLAVENVYFFKNLKTALPVSQAKGVILLAAAQKKIPTYEFTPSQIKMAITGYGRAEKKQIQEMVKVLLNLQDIPRPDDAADALAIAICYTIPKRSS